MVKGVSYGLCDESEPDREPDLYVAQERPCPTPWPVDHRASRFVVTVLPSSRTARRADRRARWGSRAAPARGRLRLQPSARRPGSEAMNSNSSVAQARSISSNSGHAARATARVQRAVGRGLRACRLIRDPQAAHPAGAAIASAAGQDAEGPQAREQRDRSPRRRRPLRRASRRSAPARSCRSAARCSGGSRPAKLCPGWGRPASVARSQVSGASGARRQASPALPGQPAGTQAEVRHGGSGSRDRAALPPTERRG
jgi:hypothetical protein